MSFRSKYTLICSAALLLQLVPIWTTRYPAMADFPNHLARSAILRDYATVSVYQAQYEPNWRAVPNLAVDLVMPILLKVASLETAGKLFLSLTVVLIAIGCHLLAAAAHGRPNWMSLVATYFVFNFFFSWGLLNYLFGLGVFLVSLSHWMASRGQWTAARVVIAAVLATIAYLSHLSAFALLLASAAVIAAIDAARARRIRVSDAAAGLAFVPPLVMLFLYLRSTGGTPMSYWPPIVPKKLLGLAYPFVTYDVVLDLAAGAAFCGVLGVAWMLRCLTINRTLLGVALVLVALYAAFPMQGGVESMYVDRRFIVAAALVFVPALALNTERLAGRAVLVALLMLWVARTAEVTWKWHEIDREIASELRVFDSLPEAARVYPVFLGETGQIRGWPHDMHFSHLPLYAVISRHAYVPTIFSGAGTFPILVRESRSYGREIRSQTPADSVPWDALLSRFDYVWTYRLSGGYRQAIESRATPIAEAGHSKVFRVRADILRTTR